MRKYLLILFFVVIGNCVHAQKVSVGTNLVEWANFVTYNGEVGLSVSRHISITAGARINNRQNSKLDKPDQHIIVRNNQKTFYAGMRYWPWYINSGLWIGGKVQYMDFSRSGLWRPALETGRQAGIGASLGYTLMLTKHFNMEFGAGAWAGSRFKYTLYDCPVCLNVRDSGSRMFAELDDISVSLIIVL